MILTIKKLIVGAIKLFANILFQVLNLFEYILFKITKKKFFPYLYDQIRKNSYTKLKINNKMIKFFSPNEIVQYRVATYFSKEPETLEWIDNFTEKENLIFWDIGANIGYYAFWLGILTAFLTAFYSWRLIILTFHGVSRADEKTIARVHESPMTMILPLSFFLNDVLFLDFLLSNNERLVFIT